MRVQFGLPDDKIVFSCSNQLYKYDPKTFDTWMNILNRVPNSVLWLLRFPGAGEPRIYAEARKRGITEDRIIFTAVAHKRVHIARSGLADVFLDTPLCNAHTTGCDVLWGGVPVVTLPLERMASRVCASLCMATGFGQEMVVGSHEEYEERAVEFGLNVQRRVALRAQLKAARLTCPLFDTRRWVRNLERVFARMWAIHAAGAPPQWFQVTESDPLPGSPADGGSGGGMPAAAAAQAHSRMGSRGGSNMGSQMGSHMGSDAALGADPLLSGSGVGGGGAAAAGTPEDTQGTASGHFGFLSHPGGPMPGPSSVPSPADAPM